MAHRTVASVGLGQSGGRFDVAAPQNVHCPREHRASGGFDSPQKARCLLPVGGHVKLIPGCSTQRAGDVLDRNRRRRGEHLCGPLCLCRAGAGQFTIRMKHPLGTHCRQVQRATVTCAEYLNGGIGFLHTVEPLRAQAYVFECSDVGLECVVIVRARGEVAPVRRRQSLVSQGLQLTHIEHVPGSCWLVRA